MTLPRLRLFGALALLTAFAVALPGAAVARDDDHDSDSPRIELEEGATSLTVAPGTLDALVANGFAVTAIKPATASGATFSFPITSGKLDRRTLAGKIRHRGGLTFTKGDVSVGVKSFVIDTARAVLTARVVGTKSRIPLLRLDLSAVQASISDETATITGVGASLTAEAAQALNSAFGTTLFADGLPIGTADVSAELDD